MSADEPSDPQLLGAAEAVRQACVEALLRGYEEAGMLGLCEEGRIEAAVDAVRVLDLDELVRHDGLPTSQATI